MPPLGVGYQSSESRGEWSVPLDSTLNSQLRVPMKRDARTAYEKGESEAGTSRAHTLKYDFPLRHRVMNTSHLSTAFTSASSSAFSVIGTMTPPARWTPASIALRELSPNSSEVERRMRRPAQTWTSFPSLRTFVPFPASASVSPAGFRLHLPSVARVSSSRLRVIPGRKTGGSGQA